MSGQDEITIINLLRDRFDQVDRDNASIVLAMEKHTAKDELYWAKIDEQQAQMRLLKWFAGSPIVGALGMWLWQKFGNK